MRKFQNRDELNSFFPEEEFKNLEVGSVVRHASHPDTTIGFVTAVGFKSTIRYPDPIWNSGSLDRTYRDEEQNRYEIEWTASPPAYENPFSSGSFSLRGFVPSFVYAPYVPLQVSSIFDASGSIRYSKKI